MYQLLEIEFATRCEVPAGAKAPLSSRELGGRKSRGIQSCAHWCSSVGSDRHAASLDVPTATCLTAWQSNPAYSPILERGGPPQQSYPRHHSLQCDPRPRASMHNPICDAACITLSTTSCQYPRQEMAIRNTVDYITYATQSDGKVFWIRKHTTCPKQETSQHTSSFVIETRDLE